jgi:hypothetical protein
MTADGLAESVLRASGLASTVRYSEPEWDRSLRFGKLASCTQQLRQCRTSYWSPCKSAFIPPRLDLTSDQRMGIVPIRIQKDLPNRHG